MFQLNDIPTFDPKSHLLNVVIDTPKGSRNKYKVDAELGVFRLSRVLPEGMQFPHDFGSIPRTCAEDGDAVDVLVLMDEPTFPGCLVPTRLLGVIRALQTEGRRRIRNDRLIAIVATQVNPPAVRSLRDLNPRMVDELEHFFVAYNAAHGRSFTPQGRLGPAAAQALVKQGMRAFEKSARPTGK